MPSSYEQIAKNIHKVVIDNPTTPNDKLVWINIYDAHKKEIEFLRKSFNFKLSHLQSSSAKITSQRPVINMEDNYIFLILHFPIFQDGTITSEEICFFIGHGYLVTVHYNKLEQLNDFFNYCKKDGESLLAYRMESSAILLYELLHKLMKSIFPLLDKNSLAISQVEELIFEENQKAAVKQILLLRRNIVNVRRIMQNHKNIFKKLMKMESSIVPTEQLKTYYKKLIDNSKALWEILENQKEMIEALNNTNESMLNFRISDIMKTLTIVMVIVYPLTLIAGIFGMNTVESMPLISHPYGFWIILVIMSLGSLAMLFFFEKKKWL